MRYELTDHEWAAIKPMLPNKPRGIPRVNDRRVLNGIFWVLRYQWPAGAARADSRRDARQLPCRQTSISPEIRNNAARRSWI